MPTSLGEFMALATAIVSLAAAVTYWLGFARREVKGPVGVAVKTASTALLALLVAGLGDSGWFWSIPAHLSARISRR